MTVSGYSSDMVCYIKYYICRDTTESCVFSHLDAYLKMAWNQNSLHLLSQYTLVVDLFHVFISTTLRINFIIQLCYKCIHGIQHLHSKTQNSIKVYSYLGILHSVLWLILVRLFKDSKCYIVLLWHCYYSVITLLYHYDWIVLISFKHSHWSVP